MEAPPESPSGSSSAASGDASTEPAVALQAQMPSATITPLEGESFRFACRPGLSCFGRCCTNLNLMILPYDAVRLARRLELSTGELLGRYFVTKRDPDTGVPRVQMRMGEAEPHPCPFVEDGACTVYTDRPAACRVFPLGRATAMGVAAALGPGRPVGRGVMERFFVVREAVCQGFDEDPRDFTVDSWLDDQGARPYLAANDAWLPVFNRLSTLASDPRAEQRFSVFLTTAYNLDRFRELAAGEAFTSRFPLSPEEQQAIAADDEALLAFAVRWLRFALYGDRTMVL